MTSEFILKHPSLLHREDIANICAPLAKLNISYFAHVRINNNREFSAISSNPLFTEHYLKNQYYLSDIHMVNESKFGNFFVWDGIEFSGKSAQICNEAGQFGVHNPFTIIERNKNSIDYYHFANNSINKQINQAYLANLDLLYLFITHFKEKVEESKQLNHAYSLTFSIDQQPSLAFEDDSLIFHRTEFMEGLSTNKKKTHAPLSKRQSEILRLVVQGKTMKEISRILNLSERTVRHYFDALKMKLNVSSRSEIFSMAIDRKIIQLL